MENESKPIFIVLLKFASNRSLAPQFMPGHKAWLQQGFDDRVFLLAGSLEPGLGGSILAAGVTRSELEARVQQDPFVVENIVTVEILEIEPGRADERLNFLLSDES